MDKRRLALLLYCLLGSSAHGQSLDYDRLESLFGEPVTMSATGKPERVSDTPATMDIITQDDIKRSGARDLATLLRRLPGVISYRGYNGTEAFSIGAILLNGREIYLASFGQVFLDSLPVELEEIRQIEVVRGPQSALYGFNSNDGVINIITYDPAQDPVDFARLRGGDESRREGAAALTVNPTDELGVRLTAAGGHAHSDGFGMPAGMSLPAQNYERTSLNALFSANLPDGSHATIEAAHSDLSMGLTVPQATLLLNARLQNDAVKADYAADTAVGHVGALMSYTSLTVPTGATYLNGGIALHDHATDGKLNDLVKLSPDDSLRAEFEARNETVHTGATPAPIDSLVLAGSVMWDHRFGSSLSMVNAVRYVVTDVSQTGVPDTADFHQTNRGAADNSSLIWRIGDDDTLRANFARGLALPSQLNVAQLGLTSPMARGRSLDGSPALASWNDTEERLTFDHQFRDWGVQSRISLFRQQTDDLISLLPAQLLASSQPGCAAPILRIIVACRELATGGSLSGSAPGLELELEHKTLSGLTWGANYSLESLRPHGTAAALSLMPALADRQTVQKANIHAGYGWGDWSADLDALYTGAAPVLTLDTLSGPAHVALERSRPALTLSPRLGWQATESLVLEASAENLWPIRLNPLQRIDSSYFLTVRLAY